MIITRSPLRISLGGGGTDLPSYYREHGGFVISAAIDKYVYITLHETFQPEFLIKYSATETVQTVDEIKHPIIREALRMVPVSAPHLEIVSLSDIPAGTGLGSSGSFTVALLRALHTLNKEFVPRQDLAEQACHIEIDLLGEPIGKQDQYIASFGGITCFEFHQDGGVDVAPLQISTETLVQPGRQSAAVLHRFHAVRLRDPRRAGPEDPRRRQRDDRRTCTRSRSSAARARPRWSRAICDASPPSCTSTGSTRSTGRNP